MRRSFGGVTCRPTAKPMASLWARHNRVACSSGSAAAAVMQGDLRQIESRHGCCLSIVEPRDHSFDLTWTADPGADFSSTIGIDFAFSIRTSFCISARPRSKKRPSGPRGYRIHPVPSIGRSTGDRARSKSRRASRACLLFSRRSRCFGLNWEGGAGAEVVACWRRFKVGHGMNCECGALSADIRVFLSMMQLGLRSGNEIWML